MLPYVRLFDISPLRTIPHQPTNLSNSSSPKPATAPPSALAASGVSTTPSSTSQRTHPLRLPRACWASRVGYHRRLLRCLNPRHGPHTSRRLTGTATFRPGRSGRRNCSRTCGIWAAAGWLCSGIGSGSRLRRLRKVSFGMTRWGIIFVISSRCCRRCRGGELGRPWSKL